MRQLQAGIMLTGLVRSLILTFAVAVLATSCAVPPAIPATVPGPTLLSQSKIVPGTLTLTPVPTATAAPASPTTAPTATVLQATTATATSIPTLAPTAISTVTATATNPSATATTLPVASPQATTANSSGAIAKLDMDKIFPPGKGRDLVLFNCTACHSFVRIVTGQRTRDAWQVVKRSMRTRVSGLSDQEYDDLFAYLEASFSDSKPVPSLPDWLSESY